MNDPLESQRCARLMAALAAPERLRIVQYLRGGPRTVSDIADMLQEPLVNASHHLTVLRHAELVCSERRGRFMIYSLHPSVYKAEGSPAEPLDFGCCRIDIPPPTEEGEPPA